MRNSPPCFIAWTYNKPLGIAKKGHQKHFIFLLANAPQGASPQGLKNIMQTLSRFTITFYGLLKVCQKSP